MKPFHALGRSFTIQNFQSKCHIMLTIDFKSKNMQILIIQKKGTARCTVLLIAPGSPSKKAGQPHPELNFVVDLYSGVPHPAHSYMPLSKCLSYSPVPGYLKKEKKQKMKIGPKYLHQGSQVA